MDTEEKIWLERMSSLHHSLMRRAAGAEGVQLVHFEILRYLSLCNRYSNTAQALSEYLGQTKGSISQSLKFLEDQGYIERRHDSRDKRYMRLFLTAEGQACLERMAGGLIPDIPENPALTANLRQVLDGWQKSRGLKGFGQCQSCRYNLRPEGGGFFCALLRESLSAEDVTKICREHEFA